MTVRRNRRLIRKGNTLPTPIHRDVYETLSLGTSLGSSFTKGFAIFAATFNDLADVEADDPMQSPRSLLVGDTSLQLVVDAANSFIASVSNIELVLMKIPQDYASNRSGSQMNLPGHFPENHPEWVITNRFIGRPSDSSVGQQYQPINLRSKKRVRLFRGDMLAIVIRGKLAGVSGAVTVSGILECRTRLD
jgi:hypothetical protein